MLAGHLLVKSLIEQGVDTTFGVPGESYLAVLDGLYDAQNHIRLITTRNEGGAAFMAEAYGKLTGKPGICMVTRGPGATNASIGVHTAMQDSTPMILFIGQIGRDMRDREAFQEIDYRAFFGPIAKWVTEIDNPDRIPEIVARAFHTALSGRPGPVVIALPEDMLTSDTLQKPAPRIKITEPAPSPEALTAAIELLNEAQKPLIVVGGGGWTQTGRDDLITWAEANDLPITTAFRYQDLMDNTNPQFIGEAGIGMWPSMMQRIKDADVVFAINTRFGESFTHGWTLLDVPNAKQKIIHAHASDRELGKIYQPDVAIHASPNQLLKALLKTKLSPNWAAWRKEGRDTYEAMLPARPQTGAVDMAAICTYLRETLDDNAIVTNGAGNFAIWPGKHLSFSRNQRYIGPQSGAMGAGLPSAIAAKAVEPNTQVICFAGDGDFQMNGQEMGTAAQEGLYPIILLLNNSMYGTIRAHQEGRYTDRVSGTKIVNPDFVKLAEAYGIRGEKVIKTSDFAPAFERAMASPTGAIIELIIDQQDITPFRTMDDIKKG
jgi:acetolactate synthase I/II/III large subunit